MSDDNIIINFGKEEKKYHKEEKKYHKEEKK